MMNLNIFISKIKFLLFSIFFCYVLLFSIKIHADDNLIVGKSYLILQDIYLVGVYNDLDEKVISKETAKIFLYSESLPERVYTAFQHKVSSGSIMTVKKSIPKVWYNPFFSERYLVAIDPDNSQGLDIILTLSSSSGMKGESDGLNPQIFSLIDN